MQGKLKLGDGIHLTFFFKKLYLSFSYRVGQVLIGYSYNWEICNPYTIFPKFICTDHRQCLAVQTHLLEMQNNTGKP